MPSHRAATDSEKNLAVALIGGAFALIVATLWGGFGLFDKVSVVGQTLVVCAGVGGCMFLLGSIIFGGLGISYGVRPGTWNRFDWHWYSCYQPPWERFSRGKGPTQILHRKSAT
jgi:hypothetical protein